jgi:hypothetical protein
LNIVVFILGADFEVAFFITSRFHWNYNLHVNKEFTGPESPSITDDYLFGSEFDFFYGIRHWALS